MAANFTVEHNVTHFKVQCRPFSEALDAPLRDPFG